MPKRASIYVNPSEQIIATYKTREQAQLTLEEQKTPDEGCDRQRRTAHG